MVGGPNSRPRRLAVVCLAHAWSPPALHTATSLELLVSVNEPHDRFLFDKMHEGLKAGGDDYLTKPFAFSELLARLEALVRRATAEVQETTLEVGELS